MQETNVLAYLHLKKDLLRMSLGAPVTLSCAYVRKREKNREIERVCENESESEIYE